MDADGIDGIGGFEGGGGGDVRVVGCGLHVSRLQLASNSFQASKVRLDLGFLPHASSLLALRDCWRTAVASASTHRRTHGLPQLHGPVCAVAARLFLHWTRPALSNLARNLDHTTHHSPSPTRALTPSRRQPENPSPPFAARRMPHAVAAATMSTQQQALMMETLLALRRTSKRRAYGQRPVPVVSAGLCALLPLLARY